MQDTKYIKKDSSSELESLSLEKKTLAFEDGSSYTGEWLKNQRHGYGCMKWLDGSSYQGYWKNDVADGTGLFIHPNGATYNGYWENDQANGFGVFIHPE